MVEIYLDEIGNGIGAKGIMIQKKFHIIGGDGNKHSIYDSETHQVQGLNHIPNPMFFHCIARVKNKVLIFGGAGSQPLDDIYEYGISGNSWNKLSIQLPSALYGVGCVSILNEQYVALFGGSNDGQQGAQDDVFIYSVHDKVFKKSNIRCPTKQPYDVFATIDRPRDDLITFGFTRSRWRRCGINNHLFPPQYLIKIICRYYWNERVHLFDMCSGEHYQIDVFELFDF